MFHTYIAESVEPLAERLAEILAEAPSDPMEPEWIATPGVGMRAWLRLELAARLGAGPGDLDGVAANLTAAFPGTLRSMVLAAGRGGDDADPWAVGNLVWTVLSVLADDDQTGAGGPIAERFGGEVLGYRQARRIADLFDRYHVHRPDMVRRWAEGRDTDALDRPLSRHHRWQPELWRRLRAEIDEPSPAEILPGLLAKVSSGDLELDLPGRLAFFGLSTLPGGPGFLDLVSAVAVDRDVHLLLLDPSPATAEAIGERIRRDGPPATMPRRRGDDDHQHTIGHPLLRSWARLPRETAVILADAESEGSVRPEHLVSKRTGSGGAETLLARVQADIRTGSPLEGSHHLASDDRSLQFHAAHGRSRQAEVAREVILHALAADPTLTEDDVLVVCPDLDGFASVIRATFGPSAPSSPPGSRPRSEVAGAPDLRHRLADRSIAHRNPIIDGLDSLLDSIPGRCDVVGVQDLIAQPAVRARFSFDDDDLARIAEWAEATEVRWGLSAEHRARFGVPMTVTANAWSSAIDSVLIGAAVADDEGASAIGGVVPLGIEGKDLDLAGRLAEVLRWLTRLVEAAAKPQPVAHWIDLIGEAVDQLLASPTGDDRDAWSVHRTLSELNESVRSVPGAPELLLDFGELRRLLRERLEALPGRPSFFRGGVTITSLDSLRWVPHRVVVLLGMDQSAFAPPSGDGDDLTASPPLLGDREPRSDRRQAILETILSAGDILAVIREGHDLATGREVPPAVVVSELLDVVAATISGPIQPASLEVHHPRQPFDERCFVPGELAPETAWSFDPRARDAAEARRQRRADTPGFLPEPLDERSLDVVDIGDLVRAVSNPASELLSRRIQVDLPRAEEAPPVHLPVELGGLGRWSVGGRILAGIRRGHGADELMELERLRGTVPPGPLGDPATSELMDAVAEIEGAATELDIVDGTGDSVEVDVTLPDGTRITGTVANSFASGAPGPARVGYGRVKPVMRIEAWTELMVLALAQPEVEHRAAIIGWDPSTKRKGPPLERIVLRLAATDPAERMAVATEGLQRLVRIALAARREPIPMFPELSRAVHLAALERRSAKSSEWRGFRGFKADGDRPPARYVWGDISLADLYDLPRLAHDPFDDPCRLEGWANYLWGAYDASVIEVDGDGSEMPDGDSAVAGTGGTR